MTESLDDLGETLSPGALIRDPDVMASAASDRAVFSPVGSPLGWVRARNVHDVQATLAYAHRTGTPVIPQGARTGLSGGANAIDGAILLGLERLNGIVAVDEGERIVTAQAGVLTGDLKDAVAARGLFYPPDPGSVAISTIGGNIATNAGGLCCVKYGVTGDYVRELLVVLADGTLTRVGRRTAKGVAGFNLAQTFVGSEGTLGVIVEATLRLLPAPSAPLTAVATFGSDVAAAHCVAALVLAGLRLSLCEFLDRESLGMISAYSPHRLDDVGGMLIAQADDERAAGQLETFADHARAAGALDVVVSQDQADSAALLDARRQVGPSSEKFAADHGGGTMVDDVCLPLGRTADFFEGLDALRESSGLMIATAAHLGDGNLHPSVYFDASDPEETRIAQEVFGDMMALGLELGGTITGEHGVGRLKSGWLARELDPGARQLHRALKLAFDPAGILNPGSMLAAL